MPTRRELQAGGSSGFSSSGTGGISGGVTRRSLNNPTPASDSGGGWLHTLGHQLEGLALSPISAGAKVFHDPGSLIDPSSYEHVVGSVLHGFGNVGSELANVGGAIGDLATMDWSSYEKRSRAASKDPLGYLLLPTLVVPA